MAQCSIWGNGHVSSCVSETLPPSTCLASGLIILGIYKLYPRKVNIQRSPRYITVLSPLVTKLEVLGLFAENVLSLVRGYQSDAILSTASPSAYLLLLVLLRLSSRFGSLPTLQSHSAALYTLQCIFCAVTAHTQVVTSAEGPLVLTTLIQSAVFAVLSLFHLTSTRRPMDDNDAADDLRKDITASFLSRMSFSWLDELVWKAFRATLEVPDLYPLSAEQKSDAIAREFSLMPTASLLRRLWHFIKYDILAQGCWAAVNSVAVYIAPALIRVFLTHLKAADEAAWLCVGGFLAGGVLVGTADCQCEWTGRQTTAKVRAVLVNEIYTKVLQKRIAGSAGEEDAVASDGGIFNLMSIDAENVSAVSGDLHFVWVTFPVQTGIGTWLLYRLLGISGVLGVLAMVLLLPLNFLVARRMMAVQAQVLTASDKRIHATNDVLNNLRTIKYSAWVRPFMERVLSKRAAEITELRARCIWWSVNMTTFHALPFIVTMITLFLYTVVWGGSLGTSTAFPALAIFGIIRIPLDRMASSVSFIMRAYVSLARIESFLLERETGKYQQLGASDSDSGRVGFENATLSWPNNAVTSTSADDTFREDIPLTAIHASPFRLENLNISFQTNALNIVCGPSGAGKSSLLLSLLGEMDLLHGHVFLPHDENPSTFSSLSDTTAYCPQDPWIMNRSIRANILMDQPFDGRRYERVLHATELQPDLAALGHGDLALAGEGGRRLSGGQKQRIALARALYSPSKCVLLDDCLSAVDAHTANHVFFHGIKGPLMRGRTCILATHAVQLVTPHCEHLVVLDEGRVVGQGTPEEVMSKGLVAGEHADTDSARAHIESATPEYNVESTDKPDDVDSQITHTETKAEGKVTWAVFRTYLTTMGKQSYWILVLLMFGAQQIAALGTNLWVKQWAFEYDQESAPKPDALYYVAVYAAIFLSYVLITFVRDLVTLYGSLRASTTIYSNLLSAILNATPLFFDRTPLGQITNRLTKDVEIMDQSLPGFAISGLQLVASMGMVIVLISTVVPAFLVAAMFICVAYYLVTVVYINGARDLKRIESVQRSPLYQHFSESLAGCVSLRAYAHATASFTLQNRELVDAINQSFLLQWATQAWLTFRIDVLSSLVSFFTGVFVLLNSSRIEPGSAGLVLTFAASFTENVMWFVQVYSIVQRNLNSVERILEYVGVEQEEEKKDRRIYDLPSPWPTEGRVSFHSFSARYAHDLDLVLDEVNFEVPPGQRVAVVGRTGAGKSSLALALIRALRAETGRIEIDGVDIRSVGLEQLRQAITLVPQDPQLFEGTIRDNLDPLRVHSDAELGSLLRDVRLGQATDSYLDQAATTLSRGQRQLLCIVRGLLRKTRIVVLDEATASVDHDTDAAIQETLRISMAQGTTVLTIAHRLHTIADYDRIVVLDGGRVVEEGPVVELLERRAVFWRLSEEAGYRPG